MKCKLAGENESFRKAVTASQYSPQTTCRLYQDKTFKFYGLLPESNVIDIASSQHGNKFHEGCVCVCVCGKVGFIQADRK
jgi:hypothetical protein